MQQTKIEKNKRKIEGERELTGGTITFIDSIFC
jgi:hypothetical protein